MTDPTKRPLSEWLTDLDISEAQADAGDVVSAETVLQQLHESIARLEAKLAGEQRREVAPRR
ncbi:MAG TPA: hypothetical protein VNT30_26075 [Stellaceae bacterium]|nr:hypothetical protein [Stellaceae bacterium]